MTLIMTLGVLSVSAMPDPAPWKDLAATLRDSAPRHSANPAGGPCETGSVPPGPARCSLLPPTRCGARRATTWRIHVGAARAPAGAALVVDVGEERELGYWGEVLTTAAESRGVCRAS